ncbi:MAG TPA: CheR family methyltransferase [Polyangia bacterium]|nr:CheR family methyltransferase [Polyangia bacterium]
MPAELRRRVAERIRRYAGLDPPAWLLDARVRDRAAALGLDEAAYLERAVHDGDEAARLADLLRVGETRFFRHRAQVAALTGRVLPERVREARDAGRAVRVWSAGCATGEEAWTLAMLLGAVEPPVEFQVLATDLSSEALAAARTGQYPAERTGDVPPALAARFLDGGRVGEALRARVQFERHNLLDARYPTGFDLILCRNVLIYFDAIRRAEVIARLTDSLRERGYLFLGYSETLRDHEELFEPVRDEDGVIYRKRARMQPQPVSKSGRILVGDASANEKPSSANASANEKPNANGNARANGNAGASEKKSDAGEKKTERVLRLSGDYHDAERLSLELRPYIVLPRPIVDLDGASFLGDDAARVLKRAAEAAPELELRSTRANVRRWLARNGLGR